MENKVLVKRIWSDDDMFEARFTARTEKITASVDCYLDDETLIELSNKIKEFVNLKTKFFSWELSSIGRYTPYFKMDVKWKDRVGHVEIWITMNSNDKTRYDYLSCEFVVFTEMGLLETFGKRLHNLTTCNNVEITCELADIKNFLI